MTKKPDIQNFDDLDLLARQATDEIARMAARDGTKLPVWRDGLVEHVSPALSAIPATGAAEVERPDAGDVIKENAIAADPKIVIKVVG